MKFGEALGLCRQGKRIYRTGWNGKNQFVYYQEGSRVPFCRMRRSALTQWLSKQAGATYNMNPITIRGHFDIFTTQNVVQCGWLATQGDMLAEDWEVLE